MQKKSRTSDLTPTALLITVMIAAPATAAELEEIVVTAERRAANLQEIPVAVSALSQDTIEDADIHDLTDVATRIPGLAFSPFSPGQNIVALRGASSNDDGAGTDNSVAVFVDDVYLGRVSNINPELFDIQRIEVLRGPQGTLYGKNTIGGAINIYSTRPNEDEFEGKVRVNIGNYDRLDLAGLFTGPLSERWAGKLALTSRKRDGWVRNAALGKDLKDDDAQGARAQLLYGGDGFEALFGADYNRLDVEDMARIPIDTGHPGDPAIWVGGSFTALCGDSGPECSANPVDGFAEREAWGVSAKLSWSLERGELISITAYRENEADWHMDSTGTSLLPLNDDILDETEQITQEIRWISDLGGQIGYVAGLWLLREETDRTECFDVTPQTDCTADADGGATDWYRQVNETTSYAVFGQADWAFGDDWTLTLGGRFTFEEKEIDNEANAGDFVVINQTFSSAESETWSAFTPRVSLAYQATDDVLVYGTVAQGFKSGGFAAAPQGIEFTDPLEQEEALNYELGLKADVTDRVRLNVAAFYTEYTDLQIQTFGPLSPGAAFGTFQTFNAGDAEARGLELEATLLLTDRLTLSGFYGYLDSEFDDTDIPGTAFPDQSGQPLIRAPENKYNVKLDYVHPLPNDSTIAFNLSYRFTDEQRGELEPWAIQPEFDLFDARLSWTSGNDAVEIAAWGRNLADETYITHLYTIASSVVAVFGEPRMYGLTGTFRF